MGDDLSITKNASSTRQVRNVIHVFRHPDYNHYEAANDIAILKTGIFKETDTLRPASITSGSPRQGTVCRLAGWGTTKEVIIIEFFCLSKNFVSFIMSDTHLNVNVVYSLIE